MTRNTARLTLLIAPEKKKAFEDLCAAQDLTSSQVIRKLMREHLERHGADCNVKTDLVLIQWE